jgi:peptidoglycan/LPS O-acetylase OafA/YrhL
MSRHVSPNVVSENGEDSAGKLGVADRCIGRCGKTPFRKCCTLRSGINKIRGAKVLRGHPRLSKNNFDLLRFLFAGAVCLFHAYALSGEKLPGWIAAMLSPKVAVEGFFVVSGFLVIMSYERSSSIFSYINKRVRRVYPAYFVVVMLCALFLWTVSSHNLEHYFSFGWLRYVAANLAFLNFLQPTLPGVFEYNRFHAIDGALWTLKVEVMFYAAVPIIVYLVRRHGRLPVLVTLYFLSVAYVSLMTMQAERTGSGMYEELVRQLPGELAYFMAGAFFYYYLPFFERRVRYFVALATLALLINSLYPIPFAEPFALATVVVFFGLYLYVGNFGKYGDFSYGIYILHYPIIQLLLYAGWFEGAWGYYLVAVVLITLAGAIAMWHLVEKRFLFRNSHYIKATNESERHSNLVLDAEAPERQAG